LIWIWEKQPEKPRFDGFVLVLGGGGGRGLSHLGVLDVLQQHNLIPDGIVGSSIGALVGTMYALQPDAEACMQQVLSFLESDTFEQVQLPIMRKGEDEGWYAKLGELARQSILLAKAVQGISVVDISGCPARLNRA